MVSTGAAAQTHSQTLFTPFELGGLSLKNRLVMAPMGTCLDDDGYISEDTIAYYRRRAEGGVGTVIVEGCLVSADTLGPEPRISGPEYLPGLRRLAEALHESGVTAGIQLLHPGRQVVAGPTAAPSPVPLHARAEAPRQLERDEIARIVDDYVAAAELALEAGYDFVEVHGAHGYLPSNFLSPRDNQRADEYGGNLENRARFTLEVARGIVERVGPWLPLVWRINGDDGIRGGFAIDEAVLVSSWLEAAGVAAISVSAGTWHSLHVTLAPMFVPRAHMVEYAAAVKRAVGVPVLAVGRLDSADVAAEVIRAEQADLIVLGRGLIADPDWPRAIEEDRREDVRPCIACNACVDLVGRGERARCAVNPEVGRERAWQLLPATAPRRVMVVGSGPAGMEAAQIARRRGHEVSIWERNSLLGGKLEVAGLAPSKREVLRFRDYQAGRLRKLGVEIHLGADVTADVVDSWLPDVVILAVGAEPVVPPIPGLGQANVRDAQDFLHGDIAVAADDRVVIIGGSATGCETAEFLVDSGAEITIVEMRSEIGEGIEAITRRHLLRSLKAAGVRLLNEAKVVMVEDDHVLFERGAATESMGADHVALALGWRPSGEDLAAEIRGPEVIVLGDASRPADFVHATGAGADAGLAV